MLLGKANEFIDERFDGFHAALHCRDGVGVTVQTHTFAPHGTKPLIRQPCSTATMCACQIAAKHKYLVLFQF